MPKWALASTKHYFYKKVASRRDETPIFDVYTLKTQDWTQEHHISQKKDKIGSQIRRIGLRSTILDTNGVAMARHGLILCVRGAAGSNNLLRHLPANYNTIFCQKMTKSHFYHPFDAKLGANDSHRCKKLFKLGPGT